MRLAVIWEKALRTDGPTARRPDGRTDTPSYRDATAHLKIKAPLWIEVADVSSELPWRQYHPQTNSSILKIQQRERLSHAKNKKNNDDAICLLMSSILMMASFPLRVIYSKNDLQHCLLNRRFFYSVIFDVIHQWLRRVGEWKHGGEIMKRET